jgi:hypothetical protein
MNKRTVKNLWRNAAFCLSALFFLPSACASRPLFFMPVEKINSQQTVELTNIEDYERLVRLNRIKTVYYTAEYFVVEANSILYLLPSRGYRNFHDYKEGKLAEPEPYSIFKPGYPLRRKQP